MCHVQVCTHACLFWVCLGTQVCLSMRRPEVDIYLSSCLSLFPLYLLIRQRAVSVGPSINLSLSKRASANCDSILSGEGAVLLCSLQNLLHLDVITHSANASSAYFMPGPRVWWPGQSLPLLSQSSHLKRYCLKFWPKRLSWVFDKQDSLSGKGSRR